ncbi:hypothetical protein AB6A40_008470 [Gnathostoma spinigerum]|uniref:Secreted protein n=1 Tax=Gnathostoma spinigerum TaxID=75299 RepID=A0ABD6EW91_9BILA
MKARYLLRLIVVSSVIFGVRPFCCTVWPCSTLPFCDTVPVVVPPILTVIPLTKQSLGSSASIMPLNSSDTSDFNNSSDTALQSPQIQFQPYIIRLTEFCCNARVRWCCANCCSNFVSSYCCQFK